MPVKEGDSQGREAKGDPVAESRELPVDVFAPVLQGRYFRKRLTFGILGGVVRRGTDAVRSCADVRDGRDAGT